MDLLLLLLVPKSVFFPKCSLCAALLLYLAVVCSVRVKCVSPCKGRSGIPNGLLSDVFVKGKLSFLTEIRGPNSLTKSLAERECDSEMQNG